jgi:hypothetical protein
MLFEMDAENEKRHKNLSGYKVLRWGFETRLLEI